MEEEIDEELYGKLPEIIDSVPKKHVLIISCDFKRKVGENHIWLEKLG